MRNEDKESNDLLKKKIEQLENRIRALESELLTKDIIVDALVSKAKIEKRKIDDLDYNDLVAQNKKFNDTKYLENRKKTGDAHSERSYQILNESLSDEQIIENKTETKRIPKEKKISDNLPGLTDLDSDDNASIVHTPAQKPINFDISELTSQIKDVFLMKSKNSDFKQNYTFKKFVDYCESSYEFSLTNKKVSKTKNPLKLFIESNLEGILKFLIENINLLNLNQICSTLFLINSEIVYAHKLVIFHDICLELENCSKLNLIACALFNNNNLENDLFSQIIKKIMFHQLSIDFDLFKDPEIIDNLNLICENMVLSPPDISLWESLSHFMVNHQLFDSEKFVVKSEAIEKGFVLRMACHYIDWDYTFNNFIILQLYPKILSDRSPIHVYYLGILAINALRLFGQHESVDLIIEELRDILDWNNNCSVVAYLILKQLYEVDSEEWLIKNSEMVMKLGFDLNYLRKMLLI